ncbi:MAG: hypothetical protein KIT15_04685 [Xanthobacteraceae bacterium]|nr:hypothetical protein [Xanthobacteraceae bacterium]MCW5673856.1 hypothetical protein [Xanthobacteraceae bacterium]
MKQSADYTEAENRFCSSIAAKDSALRQYLEENKLPEEINALQLFSFLTGIKNALGNINNDIAFAATLIIKIYLRERFNIVDFDAGGKAQGAPGIDIEAKTSDGKVIVGELKTTKPYQPGFGAAQRTSIIKDLDRLSRTKADYRFMFVTDEEAFLALSGSSFRSRLEGIELVNLTKVVS